MDILDTVLDSSGRPPSPSLSYVEPEGMSSGSSRASCEYTSGGSSLVSMGSSLYVSLLPHWTMIDEY